MKLCSDLETHRSIISFPVHRRTLWYIPDEEVCSSLQSYMGLGSSPFIVGSNAIALHRKICGFVLCQGILRLSSNPGASALDLLRASSGFLYIKRCVFCTWWSYSRAFGPRAVILSMVKVYDTLHALELYGAWAFANWRNIVYQSAHCRIDETSISCTNTV